VIHSLEIRRAEPLANGASFGTAGSYDQIIGRAKGEIDPNAAANRAIADIDKAPRNANGNVDYEVDIHILRPSDPKKGNGCILHDVLNRGNKQLFRNIADAASSADDFRAAEDVGNAFPLRRGFTVTWSGWESIASTAGTSMGIAIPVATEEGRPIINVVREEFAIGIRPNGEETFKLTYGAANLDPSRSRLTVRWRPNDPPRSISSSHWEFVDAKNVRLLPAGTRPEAGAIYELRYPARDPLVQGIGFAATRDFISCLRYDMMGRSAAGPIRHALAFGFSQSGRYLRDHISQGFNRDEMGRRVFDGVLTHAAGVGRVFLNTRFAQPFRTCTQREDHDFPENVFPFSTAVVHDSITDNTGSIFRRDGTDPLLIQTNTSTEYWQKGASLLHTDPLGERDLPLPPNSRVYLIAGTGHGGRAGLASETGVMTANPSNPHDPMPILRALLVALHEWVENGRLPPESKIPTLANGTLVLPEAIGFPDLPGVRVARDVNRFGPPADWVNPAPAPRIYRPLVCKVDADGNEIAGVRTPDIATPLGTYAGWNLYKAPFPEDVLADRIGSFIPFARTRAERARVGDPRESLAERYPHQAEYLAKVQRAVVDLVDQRLLLQEDAARYLAKADPAARAAPGDGLE